MTVYGLVVPSAAVWAVVAFGAGMLAGWTLAEIWGSHAKFTRQWKRVRTRK